MSTTTIFTRLALPNQALLFDLDTLYGQLQRVKDRRKRRGVRYPLAEILMIGILAKLAGQTSSRAIAEWAQLRRRELAQLFALRRQRMPHFSTWSRILGRGCDPDEVEGVLGQFFAEPGAKGSHPGERQLCIDGKTLRGTIPLGEAHGVHLIAAYLPEEGVVLGQVQVANWGSEPSSAPKLLRTIDLRGTVVTGDAIFASRGLSVKILQAKGDYHGTHQGESKADVSGYPDALRAAKEPSRVVCPADGFPLGHFLRQKAWPPGTTAHHGEQPAG